jgi:hypothetical protein
MMARIVCYLVVAGCLLSPYVATASHVDPADFNWSSPSGINELYQPYGESQDTSPRDARGLALSPDDQFIYIGYNLSLDGSTNRGGEVRRLRTGQLSGFDGQPAGPFDGRVVGNRGKAIATDDMGRVYLAEEQTVEVYSADLTTMLGSITTSGGGQQTEGVELVRDGGGQLVMYTTNRQAGTLEKRILTESGDDITAAALDPTFDTDGIVDLPNTNVRGVTVDDQGRIWVAGLGGNEVYRVSADGMTIDTISNVTTPIDVAVNGDAVMVTQFEERELSLFDADTLALVQSGIVPPFVALGLNPLGEPTSVGALSGIDFFTSPDLLEPGKTYGLFVNNEAGAGLNDAPPPIDDMNEPLLAVNLVPEPQAWLLAALALAGFLRFTRRRTA